MEVKREREKSVESIFAVRKMNKRFECHEEKGTVAFFTTLLFGVDDFSAECSNKNEYANGLW